MSRESRCLLLPLLAAATLFARVPGFEEYRAVQESLARVHPRMRASWLRAHGLDDSYYTTFHRPESTGLLCVGRWPWGPSWELAGRDTFLYLGSGSGVRILSIADSVHPRMLGQINARSLVSGLVVRDALLFVACGSWGAQIYSVSDPANPRELGSMDAVIGDLRVQDTFCYTAGGDSFRIYDFANPTQPTQIGAVCDSGDVIAEANGYVYVGHGSAGSGLNVYDARDPHAPKLVNTLGGVQLAMFIRGHLLFRTSIQPSYFSISDISDPASIHEVGRIDGYGGVGLYANDKYAYLSCTYDHDGLFVVDISDSSAPQLRDSINPEGVNEWGPYVPQEPGFGYLADDYGGLIVLDLHDVDSISEVWSGYKAHEAVDVVVDDQRAYVADQCSGLQIIDVADPTRPISLGIFDTVGSKITATATALDSFAFSSMSGMSGRRDLLSLNVLNPTNPVLVAQESCFNPPQDYVLRDSFLYAAEEYEFQIFNVARPREPALVGICNSQDGVYFGLVVQDSFAYMVGDGFQVFNIARPGSPFVVGAASAGASGLAVRDTFAYIPDGLDTVHIYSVAKPASPYVVAAVPCDVWPWDVALGESKMYVGASDGCGIDVYDLANPGRPIMRGRASAPDDIRRLWYGAGTLYATLWEAGLAIYETTAVGIHEQPTMATKPREPRIWPSVTDGKVRFTVGVVGRVCGLAVYDASGERIKGACVRASVKGGETQFSIDLTDHAAGVYVVRAESEGKNLTAKVVKVNGR